MLSAILFPAFSWKLGRRGLWGGPHHLGRKRRALECMKTEFHSEAGSNDQHRFWSKLGLQDCMQQADLQKDAQYIDYMIITHCLPSQTTSKRMKINYQWWVMALYLVWFTFSSLSSLFPIVTPGAEVLGGPKLLPSYQPRSNKGIRSWTVGWWSCIVMRGAGMRCGMACQRLNFTHLSIQLSCQALSTVAAYYHNQNRACPI